MMVKCNPLLRLLALNALCAVAVACADADPNERQPNEPPTAVLVIPTTIFVGEAVIFNALQSTDPDGFLVEYRYRPGDGSSELITQDGRFSYTYSEAGTFTVSLTVADDRGAMASVQSDIIVQPGSGSSSNPDSGTGTGTGTGSGSGSGSTGE